MPKTRSFKLVQADRRLVGIDEERLDEHRAHHRLTIHRRDAASYIPRIAVS
jgi:hypothetical protein